MMKKTIIILLIIIFIILVGGLIYFLFFTKSSDQAHIIDKESIEQKDFIADKQAVLYFSSTIDQDTDNKGVSYAVFIDDKGNAVGYKMKSLELGTIAKNKHDVMLVDKNKIRLVGESYREFKMKQEQHTGERTGYLEKPNLYFSIFNTGVNNERGIDGYDSNVLFGNKNGFKKGNIPHYILASGVDNNEVILLTNDIEKEYEFRKVLFTNDDLKVQDIVQLKNDEGMDYANLSPIVADENDYYIVLSEFINDTKENTVLFRINKETLDQEKVTLATYQNNNNLYATVPFNPKNSAYVYGNEFYYINGLGEVFSFDAKTHKVKIKFNITNASKDGIRHNEGTYFEDGQLYVMRYNEKRENHYYIEQYSLNTGEKIKEIKINGLEEILSSVKGKTIHAYDFKMLK